MHMNKSSGQSSTFAVKIVYPYVLHYTYKSKYSGQQLSGQRFLCYIVSSVENEYVLCQVKGGKQEVLKAKEKYKAGTNWILSKISFVEQVQASNISGALKVLVNLSKTNAEPLEDADEIAKLVTDLSPETDVCKVVNLKSKMVFDLVGMIVSMSDPRDAIVKGETKQVMDVTVVDGTTDAENKMTEIKISVWGDELIGFLNSESVGCYKPLLFIGLFAKVEKGELQISSGYDARILLASTSSKGQYLESIAHTIQDTSAEQRVTLTSEWIPDSNSFKKLDVSGDATLSCCAILEGGAETPNSMPDDFVFQLNLVSLEEPAVGQAVTTKDGDRVFFRTQMRDWSSCTNVAVVQECAFMLAKVTTKEEFLKEHSDGNLRFPILCNIRGMRQIKTATGASQPDAVGASQPDGDDERKHVNLLIAKADEIQWTPSIVPNASTEVLLNLVSHCPVDAESILPATLRMVSFCPFYGLAVKYDNGNVRNGKKAMLLVETNKKSTLDNDDNGKTVVTEGVQDCIKKEGTEDIEYTMKAFCTAKDEMDFNIVPVRGKGKKTVLITLTNIRNQEIVIDNMEVIDPESLDSARQAMIKLILASQKVHMKGKSQMSRRIVWNQYDSPATTPKKCKTLTTQPTDESLQD